MINSSVIALLLLSGHSAAAALITLDTSCRDNSGPAIIQNDGWSCSVTSYNSRGEPQSSTATAHASAGTNGASATASVDFSNRASHSVGASASLTETFRLTFFGAEGTGVFLPSLSANGTGASASASLRVLSGDSFPGWPGFVRSVNITASAGQIVSTGNWGVTPASIPFTFGQPLEVEVILTARANSLIGSGYHTSSEARFNAAFDVAQVRFSAPYQVTLFQMVPDASWVLSPIPEPSGASLLAFGLTGLLALRRLRARSKTATGW